jgi:hypothetical protein
VYKNLLNCFRSQKGSHSAEIIGIPNYNNLYENIFDALNDACDVAEGKYIIYCHEDILVKNDWLHKIKNIINNLESRSIKWGVLGPAGINKNMTSTNYHLLDKDLEELSIEQNNRIETFEEACALDEMCLIIKKSTGLRFSNKVFKGFHFYAADICAISNSLGFKNFSINAPVYHASDGFKNISTEETFIEYVNMALTAERFMNKLNIKEWRTTTLYSTNEKLIIYAVPENLKEKYGSPLIFNKPLQFDKVTK